jgi:PAS domain-containing protein
VRSPQSGADAVMIGRGRRGGRGCRRRIAAHLAGAVPADPDLSVASSPAPSSSTRRSSPITARAVGIRHARKHLGWALDAAAATCGVGDDSDLRAEARRRVLTSEDIAPRRRRAGRKLRPVPVEARGMKASAQMLPVHDSILNALPHPVISVSATGMVLDGNAAAEAFFQASISRPEAPRP